MEKIYLFFLSVFSNLLLKGLEICRSRNLGIFLLPSYLFLFFSCHLFRVWTWLRLNLPLHAKPPAAAFKAPTEVESGAETQQREQQRQHCQQVLSCRGLERAAEGREHRLRQKRWPNWPLISSLEQHYQPSRCLYHHPSEFGPFKIIKSRNPNPTLCRRERIESNKTTK